MQRDDKFIHPGQLEQQLSAANRPLRMRLAHPDGLFDGALLPQRISGAEAICDGFRYEVLCVSARVGLPFEEWIALPVQLQIVTDRGELRSICGIVTEASAGESDGGLATYQLVLRDALAILEKRINTRVFRKKNEQEIVAILLSEWQGKPALGSGFGFEFDQALLLRQRPQHEFTMQHNESDAAFIRRLLKRCGIAWYFRAGGEAGAPTHTLVMFDMASRLRQNAAGSVRYHRDHATEQRDTITAWSAVRTLQPGSVTRHSWDYGNPRDARFMLTRASSAGDQGARAARLTASLDDYLVEPPHVADNNDEHCKLGRLRMARHDYAAKCFHGESSVRDLCLAEWIDITGHPELERRPAAQRQFVITAQRILAQNNLPSGLDSKAERLFARNQWGLDDAPRLQAEKAGIASGAVRYRNWFTCVERGVEIVPDFDPRVDLPRPQIQSALVVGPPGEVVHCDRYGRVKVRFPGTRGEDHRHAHGAGASDTDTDSAWVRVASNWAGPSAGNCGALTLPRVGSEVLIAFMGGDPDKPVIINQLFNPCAPPPYLSELGDLPGNRYLSGMRSGEAGGERGNQLRLDDTPGQIGAQLASDHGRSALNLGWLSTPRVDGDGKPRGEGAELRSDAQIALRAGKGMLLSAWRRPDGDRQLARGEALALMEECVQLFRSLGKYAAEHQALAQDEQAQSALQASLKQWENGSNTAPKGAGGGAPVIAVTAPDGISFSTSKAIVSYAAANIDTVAQRHLQMSAGQRFNLNAGKGISLFSHNDGIRAIAHHGKFLLQSQHDDTEINTGKNIKLTATEGKLSGMAKVIELITEDGSFIRIGDGITLGSKGHITHHGTDFLFNGPASMAAVLPTFGDGKADQKFRFQYDGEVADDGDDTAPPTPIPAQGVHFEVALSDGSVVQSRSDADGASEVLRRDAMHLASVKIFNNKA